MSWDDIVSAAVAGSLDEGRWVELKKAIPPSSKNANLELARDLASLAADGGLLVIGVEDNKGKAGDVVGTDDLSALRDRIDQIARSTVHPPLTVTSTPIYDPSDGTRSRGCLIVAVPTSPTAPHMVDKHYWGRGDTGKRLLDDIDVQHYFAERRLRGEHAAARLHAWVDSSSLLPNTTTDGRMYFIAGPQGGHSDQLLEMLYRGDGTMAQAIQTAADAINPSSASGLPISAARNYYRGNRLEGYTTDDRSNPGSVDESNLVVIEVHENGTICVLRGRITAEHEADCIIGVQVAQEILQQSLVLAANVGSQAGYYGRWDLGVHITHTRNGADSQQVIHGGVTGAYWLENTYEQIVTVTTDELIDRREHLTYQLLLPLARTLRVERRLASNLGLDV